MPKSIFTRLKTFFQDIEAIQLTRISYNQGEFLNPFHFLVRFSSRGTTDPRDEIFGVARLQREEWKPWVLQCFVPDYSTNHLKLFKRFTLAYVAAFKSLEVLTGIWYEHCLRQLPSWVRGWSAPIHETHRFHPGQIDLYNRHYKASKDLPVVPVSYGNSMLRIQGIFVGTVTADFTLASDLSWEGIKE
ncbi:hypothetical protein H2201_007773, partial [Coniosporium apollinis]